MLKTKKARASRCTLIDELIPVRRCDLYDVSKVRAELQYCSNGHALDAEINGMYLNYGLLYCCTATGCGEQWVVCCLCTSNKQRLFTKKALHSHHSKQHKSVEGTSHITTSPSEMKRTIQFGHSGISTPTEGSNNGEIEHNNKKQKVANPIDEEAATKALELLSQQELKRKTAHGSTSTTDNVENKQTPESELPQQSSSVFFSEYSIPLDSVSDHSSLGFTSERNRRFFQHCQRRDSKTSLKDAGIQYLVTQCLINATLNLADVDYIATIPREFQQMLMEYTLLCFKNGKRNRGLMCRLVQKVHTFGLQDGWKGAQENANLRFSELHPTWRDGNNYIEREVSQPFDYSLIREGTHRFSLAFPRDEQEVRSRLLENKHSILTNLPYPDVKDDILDHAYVSLEDCLRYALGLSSCRVQVINPFPATAESFDVSDTTTCVSHPSQSRRAYEIYQRQNSKDLLVCYLYFWSDDADTNSSSMQGRAKVWVKTMTIGAPAEHGNLKENTFVVAIGTKGMSHNQVEQKHAEDLERLQSPNLMPFFIGDVNKTVQCRFEVMANLNDQPEKRGSNGLLLGSGKWAGRSFVSSDHRYLYPTLKACNSCVQKMMACFELGRTTEPLPKCQDCLNWDVLKPNTDLSLVPLPREYPNILTPGFVNRITTITNPSTKMEVRYIKPFVVTYQGISAAIKQAHFGYCQHDWTDKNCKVFLEIECLNTETVDLFLEYAVRGKAYSKVDAFIDRAYKAALEKEKQENPHLFDMMPLPALHSRPGVELHLHVEGVMHILALGVTKRTVQLIQDGLITNRCNTNFIKHHAKFLDTVKCLNLEWLKLLPYSGGKFHGWNAEEYMGFARVMPWFYQNLSETRKDKKTEVDIPSDKCQHLWLKIHNEHWLKIRGLDTDGNAEELRERVAQHLSNPPPLLPDTTVRDLQVQLVITFLYNLWETLFSKYVSEETITAAHLAIRLFLTSFDDLDATLRQGQHAKKPANQEAPSVENRKKDDKQKGKKKKKYKTKDNKQPPPPAVVSCYNFSCLLNLPEIMRTQGPLPYLWEGKYQGEGILPTIKQHHTQGIRKNWSTNLLKSVYEERSLNDLIGDGIASHGINRQSISLDAFERCYKIYSCIDEVDEILQTSDTDSKKPLSVLLMRDKNCEEHIRIFAVVHKRTEVVELQKDGGVSGAHGIEKFGQHYYKFKPSHSCVPLDWQDVTKSCEVPSIEFALLLPLLDKDSLSGMFAIISRNRKRLGPNNTLISLV